MSYRKDHIPPKPESRVPHFTVRNGADLRLAFRCYYLSLQDGHDPHYHDHINWPAPNYHGDICQMPGHHDQPRWGGKVEFGVDETTPINLPNEGYDSIMVSFGNPEYLTSTATIETTVEEGNLIRVKLGANFPAFTGKPKHTDFTVFMKNSTTGTTDELLHGILEILPGAPSAEVS